MVYAVVADRKIMYASAIWYNVKVVAANQLLSVQRCIFLCVPKCYATVSTDVLHVWSGALPLDLRAELDRDFADPVQ